MQKLIIMTMLIGIFSSYTLGMERKPLSEEEQQKLEKLKKELLDELFSEIEQNTRNEYSENLFKSGYKSLIAIKEMNDLTEDEYDELRIKKEDIPKIQKAIEKLIAEGQKKDQEKVHLVKKTSEGDDISYSTQSPEKYLPFSAQSARQSQTLPNNVHTADLLEDDEAEAKAEEEKKKKEKEEQYRVLFDFLKNISLERYFDEFIRLHLTNTKKLKNLNLGNLQAMKIKREDMRPLLIAAQKLKIKGIDKDAEGVYCELYQENYAVFIGIDNYENENVRKLQGCVNDVTQMNNLFSRMGYHVVFDPLLNEKATKKGIEKLFDDLRNFLAAKDQKEKRKRNQNSLLIIYFSGHGYKYKQGQNSTFHLCPYDFDQNKLSTNSINLTNLRNDIISFNCRHVLFILDCCFSGGIFEDSFFIPANNILVNSFLKGIWAITAGGENEQVREIVINGKMRGLFSYYLQCALSSSGEESDESLFGKEYQGFLKRKTKDHSRNLIKIVTPLEIVDLIRRKMINDKQNEHIPKTQSLFEPNSEHKGIPVLGRDIGENIFFTSFQQFEKAKEVAKREIQEAKSSTNSRTQFSEIIPQEISASRAETLQKILALHYRNPQIETIADSDKRKNQPVSSNIFNVNLLSDGQKMPLKTLYDNIMDATKDRKSDVKLMFEGSAGSGKTMLLKILCNDLIKSSFIVYIDLKEWLKTGIHDVFKYVFETYFRGNTEISEKDIYAFFIYNADKIIWIFDGFDDIDVVTKPSWDKTANSINNELNKPAFVNIIITSRPEVRTKPALYHLMTLVLVQGFEQEDITNFIGNFFSAQAKNVLIAQDLSSESEKNENYNLAIELFDNNHLIKGLISTPFHLELFCFALQEIINDKAQSANNINIEMVIDKGIKIWLKRNIKDNCQIADVKNALEHLAYDTFYKKNFDECDIFYSINRFHKKEPQKSGQSMFNLVMKSGILKDIGISRSDRKFEFIDPLIRRYLKACYYNEKFVAAPALLPATVPMPAKNQVKKTITKKSTKCTAKAMWKF